MIELELRNYLLSVLEIKEIIGKKLFANIAPQDVVGPFMVFTVVNDTDQNSVQGDNYSNNTLFQIDCYDKSYSKVKKLKGAVKKAMYEFSYHPYDFNSRDGYESNTKLHRQLINFKLKKQG